MIHTHSTAEIAETNPERVHAVSCSADVNALSTGKAMTVSDETNEEEYEKMNSTKTTINAGRLSGAKAKAPRC
jgi:hypothetical protein